MRASTSQFGEPLSAGLVSSAVRAVSSQHEGHIAIAADEHSAPVGRRTATEVAPSAEIGKVGERLEGVLAKDPGTRSVYAEREMSGFFVDFMPDRS